MSDKIIKEENLDEMVQNIVKDIKKGKQLSDEEMKKITAEANESVEFLQVLDDIKLESPNDRVIFVDGNEELVYDNGEFFICDTTDSRKPRKKLKRKEATEKYIEYFIRYQLNPIIEQKNIQKEVINITKGVAIETQKTEIEVKNKKVETKVEDKSKDKVEIKKEDKVKKLTEKVKSAPKKEIKEKVDLER